MTEHQRLLWLLSRPACAEVNQAMQELTRVNYNTGEQNKDMTAARQARDWKDTLTVLQYLQERNPFSSDPSLQSIATGVHAHPTVNVDKAVAIGDMILTSMNGTTPAEYTFRKKNQAVTLGLKSSSIKIDGDRIQIDPLLLSLLSCNHHMIWSQPSNMNYAAIHLLSLIPLFCSMKPISQHLLMPFGRLANVRQQQVSQKMEFSMSWMVEHLYNAFHGPAVVHMETSATSTQNM